LGNEESFGGEEVMIAFLDRDGVINEFPGNGNYVTKLNEFHFIPGSLDALRILKEAGFAIFVISNQAGVGKGIYSRQKLSLINRHMLENVRKSGGKITKVFYCTHRSDEGCDCRKPQIGSVRRALEMMNKKVHFAKRAFFVGDTEIDILAGHNAGCKTIFVLSGREDRRYMRGWNVKPDYIVKNLREAVEIMLRVNRRLFGKGKKSPSLSGKSNGKLSRKRK
jgi:D-glycero-D-manno-heptose 1,7-bisphosphate phosphatase